MFLRFLKPVLIVALVARSRASVNSDRFNEPTAASAPVQSSSFDAATARSASSRDRYHEAPYAENAYAVNEGKKLYSSYNCEGCHFMGGGGMGPALMDDSWIYGSDPANIFQTIVRRPAERDAFLWKQDPAVSNLATRFLCSFDVRPGEERCRAEPE